MPIYETPDDEAEEKRICDWVVARSERLAAHKKREEPGRKHPIIDRDVYFENGKLACYAEAKKRTIPFGYRDGFNLPLRKLLKAEWLWGKKGLITFAWIRFRGSDAVYEAEIIGAVDRARGVYWFGNPRRNGEGEDNVSIPWDRFRRIG